MVGLRLEGLYLRLLEIAEVYIVFLLLSNSTNDVRPIVRLGIVRELIGRQHLLASRHWVLELSLSMTDLLVDDDRIVDHLSRLGLHKLWGVELLR